MLACGLFCIPGALAAAVDPVFGIGLGPFPAGNVQFSVNGQNLRAQTDKNSLHFTSTTSVRTANKPLFSITALHNASRPDQNKSTHPQSHVGTTTMTPIDFDHDNISSTMLSTHFEEAAIETAAPDGETSDNGAGSDNETGDDESSNKNTDGLQETDETNDVSDSADDPINDVPQDLPLETATAHVHNNYTTSSNGTHHGRHKHHSVRTNIYNATHPTIVLNDTTASVLSVIFSASIKAEVPVNSTKTFHHKTKVLTIKPQKATVAVYTTRSSKLR